MHILCAPIVCPPGLRSLGLVSVCRMYLYSTKHDTYGIFHLHTTLFHTPLCTWPSMHILLCITVSTQWPSYSLQIFPLTLCRFSLPMYLSISFPWSGFPVPTIFVRCTILLGVASLPGLKLSAVFPLSTFVFGAPQCRFLRACGLWCTMSTCLQWTRSSRTALWKATKTF